ncbi:hypothetical protein [Corynebacterium sp. A21]|uniref:hypothetical protein n=1 Tax=Corynebacterium sp. A21 TaxID=3457318 RepID=UPI003FCF4A28
MSEGNLAQWNSYATDVKSKTRKLRLHGQGDHKLFYLGYTTLEYVKKKANGQEQLVAAFERFRGKFRDEARRISENLGQPEVEHLLGHVPHMHSMPATAQDVHSPIAGLESADGLKGTQHKQRDGYVEKIYEVAANVHARLLAATN